MVRGSSESNNNVNTEPRDRLKEISLEHGVVKLIAKRDIKAGSVVSEQHVNLD